MVGPGVGGAHGVEAVAVFDACSIGANNALPSGVPEVRVVQAIVVAKLMTGHTSCEVTSQPDTRPTDVAQSSPAPAGYGAEADEIKVVVAQGITRGGGGSARVTTKLEISVVCSVI